MSIDMTLQEWVIFIMGADLDKSTRPLVIYEWESIQDECNNGAARPAGRVKYLSMVLDIKRLMDQKSTRSSNFIGAHLPQFKIMSEMKFSFCKHLF